jgi:predicted PurR-regulated permease PerM
LVLVVGILYFAKPIIVPLAFAVLLTFVLTPIVSALQGLRLGRVPAVLVTVIGTFIVFGVVVWVVGQQLEKLARELPEKKEKIQQKIADLRGSGGVLAKLSQMVREIGEEPMKNGLMPVPMPPAEPSDVGTATEKKVAVVRPEPSGLEQLIQTVTPVLEPLATAGYVVILVVFMLVKREDLRNRLIGLLGQGYLAGTTRVIVDTAERLSGFLLTQLLVNVGFGAIVSFGLLIIGVPYAFLWGFLTAVLRFVPYIGVWIALAFPLILSIALSSGWTQPLIVLGFFAVVELVAANVVEPLLFGHRTGVAPVALLIAVAFWTWIWGPIGLLLSTPMTVCLVVIGQHVPRFKFLALLLGDEPAMKPDTSYYQRLLARDQKEAQQLATEYAVTQGLEKVYDDVLIPAMLRARHDRMHAGLTAEDETRVMQATREIMEHLKEKPPQEGSEASAGTMSNGSAAAPPASDSITPQTLILGCPSHNEAEELLLEMFALLLEPDGYKLEIVSSKTLPAEIEERVEQEKPKLIFIAILPPGGLAQSRYLCKRLRRRFPDLKIVVAFWGEIEGFDDLLVRLRAAGANYVTTSLLQSRSQIRALAPTPPRTTEPANQSTALGAVPAKI